MITNQAQAWISQTLIAANSALAGYGAPARWRVQGRRLSHSAAMAGRPAEVGSISMVASLSLTDSSIVQNQAIGGTGGNGVLER